MNVLGGGWLNRQKGEHMDMMELKERLEDLSNSISDVYYDINNQIDDLDSISSDINDIANEMEDIGDFEEKIEEYEKQIKAYEEALEESQETIQELNKKFANMSEVADDFYAYVCTRIVEGDTTEKNYLSLMGQLSVYRNLGLIGNEKSERILSKLSYVKEEN